jgi:ABC-type histidine transport system ATPase subunit
MLLRGGVVASLDPPRTVSYTYAYGALTAVPSFLPSISYHANGMVNEVLEVMVGLAREGMTMAVVSHEMGFTRAAAQRVIFMDEGQIIEEAPPDVLFNFPHHERTKQFLGKILSH